MIVAMILAVDRNMLIGKDGGMPWHVPGELKYFRSRTLGKPVIMGRKTFESLGAALPDRHNIVLTRDKSFRAAGIEVANDLDMALSLAENWLIDNRQTHDTGEVMIIGGAAVCREALPLTRRLYLTRIDAAFDGDTWLDGIVAEHWELVESTPAELGGYQVSFDVLERIETPI